VNFLKIRLPLFLSASLFIPGLGRAQTLNKPIPATFFGMHSRQVKEWPQFTFGSRGKTTGGTTWVWIERARGEFNWQALDRLVSLSEEHNVKAFWSNVAVPAWAASDPSKCRAPSPGSPVQKCFSMVQNIEDWDRFTTALVERYGDKLIYELWNEPDTSGSIGSRVEDMVTLTTQLHDIIRARAPRATILAPSGEAAFMDRYFAAGGPRDVDAVTFHYYALGFGRDRPIPEEVVGEVTQMRQVMAKYGLANKPLWNTEGGFGRHPIPEEAQAAFVARFYLVLWSLGVERFYWYDWEQPSLWTVPAGKAYQEIYKWMVGATMRRPCTENAEHTWTCGFARPGGYEALAVWNTEASFERMPPSLAPDGRKIAGYSAYVRSAEPRPYKPDSKFRQYRDLAGHTNPVRGTVMVGSQPILLETSSAF
jgi:hypothetical protein